jgi:hypothetical protein
MRTRRAAAGTYCSAIGERVNPGTRTHRILNGSVWVWAKDDVRDMVEQTGFTDVTVQYGLRGADSALNRLFAKVTVKSGRFHRRRLALGPRHQAVARRGRVVGSQPTPGRLFPWGRSNAATCPTAPRSAPAAVSYRRVSPYVEPR